MSEMAWPPSSPSSRMQQREPESVSEDSRQTCREKPKALTRPINKGGQISPPTPMYTPPPH